MREAKRKEETRRGERKSDCKREGGGGGGERERERERRRKVTKGKL